MDDDDDDTQTRALISFTDFSLHIRSPPFAVSVHILQSPIHTHLSPLSCSFLLVAGCWLSCSCRCFPPLWESQNVRTWCQKCCIYVTWKTTRHLASRTEFCRTAGRISLKPIKLGLPSPLPPLKTKSNRTRNSVILSRLHCGLNKHRSLN